MKHSNGIFYHEKHDTKTRQRVSTDAIRAERSEQEVPAVAFHYRIGFPIRARHGRTSRSVAHGNLHRNFNVP